MNISFSIRTNCRWYCSFSKCKLWRARGCKKSHMRSWRVHEYFGYHQEIWKLRELAPPHERDVWLSVELVQPVAFFAGDVFVTVEVTYCTKGKSILIFNVLTSMGWVINISALERLFQTHHFELPHRLHYCRVLTNAFVESFAISAANMPISTRSIFADME